MRTLLELFVEYYHKTYIINGEVHFRFYKLPIKSGLIYCKGKNKSITIDFNLIHEFIEIHKNCDFVTIEGENYKIK